MILFNDIALFSAAIKFYYFINMYEFNFIYFIEFLFLSIFRYNTLDVDTILNNDRLVTNYVDCLLSRKPCSPEGKELKRKCNAFSFYNLDIQVFFNVYLFF